MYRHATTGGSSAVRLIGMVFAVLAGIVVLLHLGGGGTPRPDGSPRESMLPVDLASQLTEGRPASTRLVVLVMDDCPHCHALIDELKSATQSCCPGSDVTRLITIVSLGGRPWHMDKGPLQQSQWLTDVSGRWGRALHIVATPTIIVYGSDRTMLFRQKGVPSRAVVDSLLMVVHNRT